MTGLKWIDLQLEEVKNKRRKKRLKLVIASELVLAHSMRWWEIIEFRCSHVGWLTDKKEFYSWIMSKLCKINHIKVIK